MSPILHYLLYFFYIFRHSFKHLFYGLGKKIHKSLKITARHIKVNMNFKTYENICNEPYRQTVMEGGVEFHNHEL